jgi:hypothetical protein
VKLETVKLADPFDVKGTLEAKVVVPSKKLTLPVAGAPLVVKTVAVRVTGWHGEDGFGELVKLRLVGTFC